MSDIDWYEAKREPQATSTVHADLKRNREAAKIFIERVSLRLEEGMSLTLGSDGLEPDRLLWVKWSVPKGIPGPDYAEPINLNQSHEQVKASIEWVFNRYLKIAKDFWEKRNQSKIVDLKTAI